MKTNDELIEILRTECKLAGGQSKWADKHNIDRPKVSATLSGKLDMAPHIATALGYKAVRVWVKVKK